MVNPNRGSVIGMKSPTSIINNRYTNIEATEDNKSDENKSKVQENLK